MKFQALVYSGSKEGWWETYDLYSCTDRRAARKWMYETVRRFNETLRPGERPRVFRGHVRILGEGTRQHIFEKTNLVTISQHGLIYDTYRCTVCGCTGRRYGLDSVISRDKKFKNWEYCPGEKK